MMSGGRGMPLSDLPDPLPAGAVLGIVQLDPHRQELLPDLVRAGEVTAIACRPPLRDEPFDLGVDRLREADHVQHSIRVPQHGHRRSALVRRRLALLQARVEGLDELEEMSDRGREVEVITQRVVPALLDLEPPTLTLPRKGGGNWTTLTLPRKGGGDWTTLTLPRKGGGNRAEAHGELVEPLDRTCGGLEELGRKRQWTPVMRAGHERIADGARLIA